MTKNPTTVDQQVQLLVERGLVMDPDDAQLRTWLANAGYYRLSGYWRYFQVAPGDGNNQFLPGTNVREILDPVEFDAILRSLLLDALADAEVALKAHLSNAWAHHTSSVGYLDEAEFNMELQDSLGESYARETKARIRQAIDASREEYIAHHRSHLGEDPPIWVGLGVVTLGTTSKLYKVCNHVKVKQQVASALGLKDINTAESALEGLSVLRNLCAHHHRLWNRTGLVGVRLPNAWKTEQDRAVYHRTPWALIELVRRVVSRTGLNPGFSERLDRLLKDYEDLVPGLKKPYSTKRSVATVYMTHS